MSEHDPPRTALPATIGAPLGEPRATRRGARTTGRPPGVWRVRRRWVVVVALAVLVLVACVVADHVDLAYYELTPGVAQPVAPLVKVPPGRGHRVHGQVLLTDVFITQVTALSYVFDVLRGNSQMLPVTTVLGPATPPSQLLSQGYLEMEQSQEAAKAAALTRLGYDVKAHNSGTVVFSVVPGTPAANVLAIGQIVTSVDGRATPDACAFAQALALRHPGQQVDLSVERSSVNSRAVMVPGPIVHERVRLGRWPTSVPHPVATSACPGTGWHTQGFLGVQAETQVDFHFPFAITLRTTSIGGPSAGLAMTLGILDTLSGSDLTGGHTIAATGTIAPTGAVGAVGGVPEKTVAVERAGATVFFVPATQVATARSKATPSLEVYGVHSLGQVLSDLRRLGGVVPPPPTSHGS